MEQSPVRQTITRSLIYVVIISLGLAAGIGYTMFKKGRHADQRTADSRCIEGAQASARELSAALQNPERICSLGLQDQKLSELPPEIGRFQNLVFLSLDNNELTALPPEIGNITNLQSMRLFNNKLESIPAEIGNLTNLKTTPHPQPKG